MIPNDDNRIADGVDLRNTFLSENGFEDSQPLSLNVLPVSVLEVIIALSDHLSFITDGSARMWAWQLIENLKLDKMCDPVKPRLQQYIDDALESLIWRTYQRDGRGGFFPLIHPNGNQLKVEIWYQMHQYLAENQHDT